MHTGFEEANLFAYHAIRGVLYDVIIWCLAPVIDDSRRYGRVRFYLAALTCTACRRLMRIEE